MLWLQEPKFKRKMLDLNSIMLKIKMGEKSSFEEEGSHADMRE